MVYEDFTGYTEVDEDGDITVAANLITVDTLRRDALSYVAGDYGAGHFGDFEHFIQAKRTFHDISTEFPFWGLGNTKQCYYDAFLANDGCVLRFYRSGPGVYSIYLLDFTTDSQDGFVSALNTDLWCTIKRDGATLTAKLYDDEAKTNLVGDLSVVCDEGTYRYVYGLMGHHRIPDVPANSISMTVQNLDIQEVVEITPTESIRITHEFHIGGL